MARDEMIGVFGDEKSADAFTPVLDREGITHRWERNHLGRMVLFVDEKTAGRAEALMFEYLGVSQSAKEDAATKDRRGGLGCLTVILGGAVAALGLL